MEVVKGMSFTINYKAQVVVSPVRIEEKTLLKSMPIMNLDHEVLPYISPSRHCESDKLMEFATKEFGFLPDDYSKVLAIEDWIFANICYTTGSTNSSASATDTLLHKTGVCKDFAHLGIALCRALDIPARYFTGYASHLNPPDFHACFEAYIGGYWIIFDPTKLAALNGLVKIATLVLLDVLKWIFNAIRFRLILFPLIGKPEGEKRSLIDNRNYLIIMSFTLLMFLIN
jgi:transglutaminase-like putative cysteine protease